MRRSPHWRTASHGDAHDVTVAGVEADAEIGRSHGVDELMQFGDDRAVATPAVGRALRRWGIVCVLDRYAEAQGGGMSAQSREALHTARPLRLHPGQRRRSVAAGMHHADLDAHQRRQLHLAHASSQVSLAPVVIGGRQVGAHEQVDLRHFQAGLLRGCACCFGGLLG